MGNGNYHLEKGVVGGESEGRGLGWLGSQLGCHGLVKGTACIRSYSKAPAAFPTGPLRETYALRNARAEWKPRERDQMPLPLC